MNPTVISVINYLFGYKKPIDMMYCGWHVGSMEVKTSITLSDEIIKAIDLYLVDYRSRSQFLETAARKFILATNPHGQQADEKRKM